MTCKTLPWSRDRRWAMTDELCLNTWICARNWAEITFFIFSRLVSTQHFDCCDYKYRCRRHHRPRCTTVDICKVAISSCTADQIIGDTNGSHDNRTSMYGWKNMLWKGRDSKMVQVEIVIYHRHSSRSPFSLKTSKRVGCIVSSQVGSFWLFFFFFSLLWFFGCSSPRQLTPTPAPFPCESLFLRKFLVIFVAKQMLMQIFWAIRATKLIGFHGMQGCPFCRL